MCPVVDFSAVTELTALPQDTYRCTIADFSSESGPKGKYYKVKFTVTDDESEYNGRSVYRNYSLSPAALFALKRFMLAAGTDALKFAGPLDTDEEMIALKGAEVDVEVKHRDFNDGGEIRVVNEVGKVSSPGF